MKKTDVLKEVLFLTLLILLALFLSGVAYQTLKKPIQKQEKKEKEQDYQAIFPEGVFFQETESDYEVCEAYLKGEGFPSIHIRSIVQVQDDKEKDLGKIYSFLFQKGYGDGTVVSLGINNGIICGVEVWKVNTITGLEKQLQNSSVFDRFLYEKISTFSNGAQSSRKKKEPAGEGEEALISEKIVRAIDMVELLDAYFESGEGGSKDE